MLRTISLVTSFVVACPGQQPLFAVDSFRTPLNEFSAAGNFIGGADLNGDGRDEFVTIGGLLPNQLSVNERLPGSDVWIVSQVSLPATNRSPVVRDIEFADLDGDGDQDLLVAIAVGSSQGFPSLASFLNDGTGRLRFYRDDPMLVALAAPLSIAAGDLDGDGDIDALVGMRAIGTASLYQFVNNGSGAFINGARAIGAVRADETRAELLDWDGDGDLDALLSRSAAPTELLRNSNGTLTPSGALSPAARDWVDAVVFDADGDGDPDVVGRDSRGALALVHNDPQLAVAPLPGSWRGFVAGDFDGDGDVDLMTRDDNTVAQIDNDGRGGMGPARFLTPEFSSTALVATDLNADGIRDAVVLRGAAFRAVGLLGSPSGLVVDAAIGRGPRIPAGAGFTALMEDLDNDGRIDLVLSDTSPSRTVEVYFNRGAGVFSRTEIAISPVQVNQRLLTLDVDRDGDLDLIQTASGTVGAVELSTQTAGAFSRFTALPIPPQAVAVGELTGDGIDDLVATGVVGGVPTFEVYAGDGVGWFLPGRPVPDNSFASDHEIEIGDWDGDGDQDLLVFRAEPCVERLDNDGSGGFTSAGCVATLQGPFAPAASAESADIDGDGDLDVVAVVHTRAIILLNDGSGSFTDGTAAWLPGSLASFGQVQGAHPFDADNDGDIDLVVSFGGASRLLLNLGTNYFDFTDGLWVELVMRPGRPVSGDLDGDGDPEVLVANTLMRNHLRGLSAPVAPRIGRAFTLDVTVDPQFARGGAGCFVAVGFAPASRPVSIRGLRGTLQFDTAGSDSLGFVVPSAPQGTASLNLVIPPSPSLVGLELFFQGLAFSRYWGAGFTNAVFERVLL